MKKLKMAYAGWVLGLLTLLVGAQSSFALKCDGKVYFQPLKSWTEAHLYAGGTWVKLKETDGWYVFDAISTAGQYETKFVFSGNGLNSPQMWFTKSSTYSTDQLAQNDSVKTLFTCSDFNGQETLYIFPDPTDSSKTVVSNDPPNAKRLHVLLPANDGKWMASTPMLTQDGTFKGAKPLAADAENCGWYTYTWFNSEPTDEVLLVRDDDSEMESAVGDGGVGYDGTAPMPLMVASLFELFGGNDLYFVMDDSQWDLNTDLSGNKGFSDKLPTEVTGSCSYELAAIIYDTDASLHPAFSCWSQGGEACQKGAQGISATEAVAAVDACLGVTPGLVEDILGDDNKPVLSKAGEKCFLKKELFNQLFNYTQGVNEMSCFDMPFGRASDGKWEFDSDNFTSPGAKAKGGFYPVELTTDSIIKAAKADQVPVPAARTKHTAEGPIFFGPLLREYDEKEGAPKVDLLCNGPGWNGGYDCTGKFNSGNEEEMGFVTKFLGIGGGGFGQQQNNSVCVIGWSCSDQSPNGWTYYKEGTETPQAGGAARWTSNENAAGTGGRNQQFCFESHASFTYKPGLRFTFRGDDDIWVFIDKKLAVDLGGTHLAAPGYVDMDSFKGKSGALKVGSTYDLDIFFCDRRTTMSNVRIKTNMYIKQTSGLVPEKTGRDAAGGNIYELCYTKTGDGSCTSKALGGAGGNGVEEQKCGEELAKSKNIEYHIEDANKKTIVSSEQLATAETHCGGIDLSNRANPVINTSLINGCNLKSGRYELVATVDGTSRPISFRVAGSVDVVTRNAVVVDTNGHKINNYVFTKQSLAGAYNEDGKTIDRSQLVPILITSVSDPCEANPSCEDPLEMDVNNAMGVTYTVALSLTSKDEKTPYDVKNAAVYMKDAKGNLVRVNNPASITRTVDEFGIDTIFVTVPFDDMPASEVFLKANLSGGKKVAKVGFFIPRLSFVESEESLVSVSSDPNPVPDTLSRWVGSPYELHLIALAPSDDGKYVQCGELCNFPISVGGTGTSGGIEVWAKDMTKQIQIVNGRTTIVIRSQKEYYCESNQSCSQGAKLEMIGPTILMKASYNQMQFQNPPVPIPVLADIFDVHGATSTVEMNVPAPYFSAQKEYLDGIADSLVVYYSRPFYNHPDSLPIRVVVFWAADEKDSVELDSVAVFNARSCGAAAGIDDTLCLPRLTFGGVNFSKDVKTGGVGTLKSWATYYARNETMTSEFPGKIQDRVAPVILSAKVDVDTSDVDVSLKQAKLFIKFSESVKRSALASAGMDNQLFAYYLNSDVNASESNKFHSALNFIRLELGNEGDSSAVIFYNQGGAFPQSGDYIHFGGVGDDGYVEDYSAYRSEVKFDSLRGFDYSINWNTASAYDASARVPSPWVLITGDVSTYATRIAENGVTGVPADKAKEWAGMAESGLINPVDVFTVDGIKDEASVFNDIKAGVQPFANYGFTPHGWYVKSDMGALIDSKESYASVDKNEVYFQYEVRYFTNLGNFVAADKGKIYCSDAKNMEVNGKQYFNGGNCVDNRRNFVIIWNMLSEKKRLVGSGAYISKLTSFVKLADEGKKNKTERTQMWGVRRGSK